MNLKNYKQTFLMGFLVLGLIIWSAYDQIQIVRQQNNLKAEIELLKQDNEILNEEIFELQQAIEAVAMDQRIWRYRRASIKQ